MINEFIRREGLFGEVASNKDSPIMSYWIAKINKYRLLTIPMDAARDVYNEMIV